MMRRGGEVKRFLTFFGELGTRTKAADKIVSDLAAILLFSFYSSTWPAGLLSLIPFIIQRKVKGV